MRHYDDAGTITLTLLDGQEMQWRSTWSRFEEGGDTSEHVNSRITIAVA